MRVSDQLLPASGRWEMYTGEEAPRTGTAVALQETVCLRFWRHTFAELLKG